MLKIIYDVVQRSIKLLLTKPLRFIISIHSLTAIFAYTVFNFWSGIVISVDT